MVTETKLKKLKIDVVSELHEIRKKNAGASSAEIEQTATEVLRQIRKKNNLIS